MRRRERPSLDLDHDTYLGVGDFSRRLLLRGHVTRKLDRTVNDLREASSVLSWSKPTTEAASRGDSRR
jgi:hypothetical protein